MFLFLLDNEENDGFVEEAEFTFSRRGHFKLVRVGYIFYKREEGSGGRVAWHYQHYATPGIRCRVTAQTKRINSQEKVKVFGEHLHPKSH